MMASARTAYEKKRSPAGVPRWIIFRLLAALLKPEVAGAELVHQFEDATAAARDAGERILGDDDRYAGFLGDEFVDIAQ